MATNGSVLEVQLKSGLITVLEIRTCGQFRDEKELSAFDDATFTVAERLYGTLQ